MLNKKMIRENKEQVIQRLETRGTNTSPIETFLATDKEKRMLIKTVEELKQQRNETSKQVATLKKQGQDATSLIQNMKKINDDIKRLDEQIAQLESVEHIILSHFPNLPHESVPIGRSEEENVEVRKHGELPTFSFDVKPHEEIGENLGILDFPRAAKVTGSRFVFTKGAGARLERALINFMLDVHTSEHGYTEFIPPQLVNEDSLFGTGQLPKFEEDLFKMEEKNYYLIPTAEVPVTNYHRNEVLTGDDLPLSYTAHSACFRSEAGSAGRDTKGLIRQHQFSKVELVKVVKPEDSYEALEQMTKDAEKILQLLELPYRVITLCTGDMGFTSAKTYDLEVWFPHQQTYREISSASNTEDFQARRANIRFKRTPDSKTEYVHTLNASGLAVGRCFAAILENYQQEDGSVIIPTVLRPYMRNQERI